MATNYEQIAGSSQKLVDNFTVWKESCALAYIRKKCGEACMHYGECNSETTKQQQREWSVEWLQEECE